MEEQAEMPTISHQTTSINLRDYQIEAKNKFFEKNMHGTFLYATGTGKTEVAIGIIDEYLKKFPDAQILFLVPRITLVEQTQERLRKYNFESGMYYSLEKDLSKHIVISTYQSVSQMLDILDTFSFVIYDEVHLASDYAEVYAQIMYRCIAQKKHMLCLTATIDTGNYERYGTILESCPVLNEITLREAINKDYLTQVVIEDHSISLSGENQSLYAEYSEVIREVSRTLGTSNPRDMVTYLHHGNKDAARWFKAVQARKLVMEYNEEKIEKAISLINSFNNEQTIVFCERTVTLEKLKELLGDKFEYITAKTGKKKRQQILDNFGKTFSVIGTVHTLDLGYDVPNLRHGIVIASNKNETTIVQRIGRLVRKSDGKASAKVYVIYARGTHETNTYRQIKKLVNI